MTSLTRRKNTNKLKKMDRRCSLPQDIIVKLSSTTTEIPNTNRRNSFRNKIRSYCSTCVNLCDTDDAADIVSTSWSRFIKPGLFILTFVVIVVILAVFLHPKSDKVCFLRLGCFSTSGAWAERGPLFNFFPQSPSIINTTFIVTSRHDPSGKHGVIAVTDFGAINEVDVPWNNSSLIIFLIHGYTDETGTWVQKLKDAFLHQADDIIVILVDWRSGASGHYPQVVANTRVVAREITLFIQYIQRRFGNTSPKRVHLVGHSLGSQISSYVGKAFVNSSYEIYQITALDPAFPLFEGYSPEIRLHRNDAQYVLAIHSNIGPWGLGMKNPVGTVDIYLNNGRDQRGCPKIFKNEEDQDPTDMRIDNSSLPKIFGVFSDLKDILACSHRRAYDWLIDALRDLAGTLYVDSAHPLGNTTIIIGYSIKWENETDIAKLAKNRAIAYSLCTEDNENGCWKIEQSQENAMFRFPSVQSNESLSYLIPTSNRSAFCVRLALLEIYTCHPPVTPSPILGWLSELWGRSSKQLVNVTTVTFSQAAFEEETLIYQGHLRDSKRMRAWVEFPCEALQSPAYLQHDGKLNDSSYNGESNLSVKLIVSIELPSNEQRKSSSSTTARTVALKGPSVCVRDMKLTYFNETEKAVMRLNWRRNMDNKDDGNEKLIISSEECVEAAFSAA